MRKQYFSIELLFFFLTLSINGVCQSMQNFSSDLEKTYYEKGRYFDSQMNLDSAEYYYFQSINLYKQELQWEKLIGIYLYLTACYNNHGKYDKALNSIEKAYKIYEERQQEVHVQYQMLTYLWYGRTAGEIGDLELSERQINKAFEIIESLNNEKILENTSKFKDRKLRSEINDQLKNISNK